MSSKKFLINSCKSFMFITLKSVGAFYFSVLLIEKYGEIVHAGVMEKVALLLGLSLICRLGLDQGILKHGINLLENSTEAFNNFIGGILYRVLFITFAVGSLLVLYTNTLYDLIWLLCVSVSFLYLAIIKVKGYPEYSSILEVGFVLLIAVFLILMIDPVDEDVELIVMLSWVLLTLLAFIIFPIRISRKFDHEYSRRMYSDIYPRLLVYSLSSLFNFFTSWGVLLIAAIVYLPKQASDFALVIRVCAFFTVIMMAINAYVVPKIGAYYQKGNLAKLNQLFGKFRLLYLVMALGGMVMLLMGAFLGNMYVDSLPMLPMQTMLVVGFGYAFNLATGPTAMCMVMVGEEKLLLIIRALSLLMFLVLAFVSSGKYFAVLFCIYLVIQSVLMIFFLKKNHGLSVSYF